MRWSWLIVGLLLLLLLSAAGLGARSYANRGYPDAVYYYRYVIPGTSHYPGVAFEVWNDPARHWTRTLATPETGTPDARLYRDGSQYDLNAPGGKRAPYNEPTGRRRVDARLQAGGLPRLNAWLYAGTAGRRSRVTFHGRAALRVDSVDGAKHATSEWFDARTHELLGQRFIEADGNTGAMVVMRRYTRWARYAPHQLPADFFDAPSALGNLGNLWDRLVGWLRSRFAGG